MENKDIVESLKARIAIAAHKAEIGRLKTRYKSKSGAIYWGALAVRMRAKDEVAAVKQLPLGKPPTSPATASKTRKPQSRPAPSRPAFITRLLSPKGLALESANVRGAHMVQSGAAIRSELRKALPLANATESQQLKSNYAKVLKSDLYRFEK